MLQSHLDVIEDDFGKLILGNTALDKLWTGGRWLEGPAYFAAHRSLVFSDIPNNRMLRFDEATETVGVFRTPSMHANGNTRDREGRLVTCEHSGRRVTRTEHDGSITILADRYDGKRFNSPNDVVVHADGSIWFTDPTYGIDKDYEGGRAPEEIGGSYVYRIDPSTGAVAAVATDFVKPNGLAFSPDYSVLYIADTGVSHIKDGPRHIRRFSVTDGKLSGGEVFATCTYGLFDGFRMDEQGNLWSSAGDGVHVYNPSGTLIGKIKVPEVVANVCWGTHKRNRLYICGTTSLYATYVFTNGMPYPG
ncbi:SMP-30/gluconolactonase/LRE family protein [Acuticoccus sp. I52.16.1]|uniref:SMP-30/gluconolactonase/LRE family protein n=1 Tax=Acuticoccus sp. I52.16.1 TaxID=2928472 RepID=UPI001FD1FB53|nr:SMP-30/gluconolactonase/LRE family protein [Acuticoccus sp. I52.16.1]UOM34631.1 SMP-30/gluconolactonase/LRE family protein [Acuticoccus sp. I52.16.1]